MLKLLLKWSELFMSFRFTCLAWNWKIVIILGVVLSLLQSFFLFYSYGNRVCCRKVVIFWNNIFVLFFNNWNIWRLSIFLDYFWMCHNDNFSFKSELFVKKSILFHVKISKQKNILRDRLFNYRHDIMCTILYLK